MMRKGDLAEYSPEWVLRTAAQEGVDGGIEFDVARRISVYLTGGRVYLVLADSDPDEPALDEDLDDHAFAAAVQAAEHRLLPHALDLLGELLGHSTGEYFHHPLNEHPLIGEWDWDTVDLVDEAMRRRQAAEAAERAEHEAATGEGADDGAPEATDEGSPTEDPAVDDAVDTEPAADAPAPWGDDSLVRLTGTAPAGAIGPDGWALIAAMAETTPVGILAARLGWTPERVAEVLTGLSDLGAVSEESFGSTAFQPPASATG